MRALILTHGDTDHIGFAARPHCETRIAAYIHKADVDRVRLTVKKPNSGWGPVKIGPLAGFLCTPLVAAGCGSGRRPS